MSDATAPLPPRPPAPPSPFMARWSARLAPLVRAFHTYATWLVSISWKRFFLLSVLLMIIAGILSQIPPFTWTISERRSRQSHRNRPRRPATSRATSR
jgi:hypothetical protein